MTQISTTYLKHQNFTKNPHNNSTTTPLLDVLLLDSNLSGYGGVTREMSFFRT